MRKIRISGIIMSISESSFMNPGDETSCQLNIYFIDSMKCSMEYARFFFISFRALPPDSLLSFLLTINDRKCN